ncbi:MAG: alpha/beta fold hydrolase [Pseudomonadota bacterium]|nr:alpha/beta fold hydrolase [Pseudomonadota bacterium]
MAGYGGPMTEAGRPPRLLIIGSPRNAYVWNNVAAALSVETEVLKPTLAGHSADRETPITDIEVSAIAMQLEPLFSGKDHAVDVEGHSFGGAVALRLGAPTEIVDPPSVIAGTRRHLYLSCNRGHGNT